MAGIMRTIRIANRVDTLSNWQKSTHVPAKGELLLAKDGKYAVELRMGDGVHTFCDCPVVQVRNDFAFDFEPVYLPMLADSIDETALSDLI